jgi:tetratricopeptide (TPR) repeat protein
MANLIARCLSILLFCGGCASTTAVPSKPVATPTDNAPTLYQLGQEQARYGDNLRAEQYYLAAQRAGYPDTRVLPRLLEVCISSGRLRSALGYAEPYLRRHPEDFALRHLVASIRFGLGDAARAFRELEGLLGEVPKHAPSHYLLAVIADEAFADVDAARRYFQGYLALDPHGEHAAEASSWLRDHPTKKPSSVRGKHS